MKRFEQLTRAIRIGVIAMATVTSPTLSSTPAAAENNDTAIRPFRVTIPDKEIVELRGRVAATRWPTKELVGDRSQGVQLATLKELARYWSTEYDWRKAEAREHCRSSRQRSTGWRSTSSTSGPGMRMRCR